MIRLFIALPIPQEIRPFLHRIGSSLPYAKPVPEEQIHLTLRFIGDVEGSQFIDIKQSLSSVTAASFRMSIQGVGHFPPRGKPRVIWAGAQPAKKIQSLKKKIDTCLRTCKLDPDKRKFFPHVTLARLKDTPVKRVSEFLAGNAFLHFDEFEANCFQLYSSKLTPKGAIHTLEASYSLWK